MKEKMSFSDGNKDKSEVPHGPYYAETGQFDGIEEREDASVTEKSQRERTLAAGIGTFAVAATVIAAYIKFVLS